MFDYVTTAQEARDILADFGGGAPGATFTRSVGGGGQPGTSVAPTVSTWSGVALIFDYARQDGGTGTYGSTLIKDGDRQLYLAAMDSLGAYIMPPAPTDKCLAPDGATYRVETVKPIAPNGAPVMFDIQLRR